MPIYNIRIVNQHFTSSNEQDSSTVADASIEAIKGALEIGIAEVSMSKPFFAAEVTVADGCDRLARFIVSMGVSPIQ